MMIIGIGFFAVQPQFLGALQGARERSALRQLVGLFTGARAEAVGTGKLVRVICDVGISNLESRTSFHAEVQSDPQQDRQLFDPLRLAGKTQVLLPEHLTLEDIEVAGLTMTGADTIAIYFYPDGRTDGAAMLLTKGSGDTVVLELMRATGRVSIRERQE
jgi:Tfp pilus assembly protein FimT